MNFWWVNHKQTHRFELDGGYIWAPKRNASGSVLATYQNLYRTCPGDIVFSYASQRLGAVGVVEGVCQTADNPHFAAPQWSSDGWYVPVQWNILNSPISPKRHPEEVLDLLPQSNSPLLPRDSGRRKRGDGLQNCYLASISEELGRSILKIMLEAGNSHLMSLINQIDEVRETEHLEEIYNNEHLTAVEKEQLAKARIGQGLFRKRVEEIECACRLTGATNKAFLIASHIKPWSLCTKDEKLDGHNGFLLSPHVDKLFDKGWITFRDDGQVLCIQDERYLVLQTMDVWKLKKELNVGTFTKRQKEYLQFHRAYVFGKKQKLLA